MASIMECPPVRPARLSSNGQFRVRESFSLWWRICDDSETRSGQYSDKLVDVKRIKDAIRIQGQHC